MKAIIFTEEGFAQKKKEYEELKSQRPEAVENLRKAREMGDLSENGYYHAAKARLVDLDRRVRQLMILLRFGKIAPKAQTGAVGVGSNVTVEINGKKRIFEIVGGYESDPVQGKISFYSPIGRALVGKRAGEMVSVTAPAGKVEYKIVDIT